MSVFLPRCPAILDFVHANFSTQPHKLTERNTALYIYKWQNRRKPGKVASTPSLTPRSAGCFLRRWIRSGAYSIAHIQVFLNGLLQEESICLQLFRLFSPLKPFKTVSQNRPPEYHPPSPTGLLRPSFRALADARRSPLLHTRPFLARRRRH